MVTIDARGEDEKKLCNFMHGISPYLIFIVIHGLLSPVCAVGVLSYGKEKAVTSPMTYPFIIIGNQERRRRLSLLLSPLYMMHIKSG